MRIATFNCENLFSRPRIFKESAARSKELLRLVSELQSELQKHVFDQARIKALKAKLAGFASVVDVRGKHLKVKGAEEWLGWVELSRTKVADVAVENTARVIRDVDADVLALMEIENRPALQKFHDELLFPQFLDPAGKQEYEHIVLIDGNDDRGIDVAVMSRLPIVCIRTHIHERSQYFGNDVPTFSRDCLEVRISLPAGQELHLMANHLKSKLAGKKDPQSQLRREQQAKRVAELLSDYDLKKHLVVVAGDLNDHPDGGSLDPLLGVERLYNVNMELEPKDRWTYHRGGKQIDYVLISEALKSKLIRVQIERRGIFRKTGERYPTVTDRRTEASDHAAVVADIDWEGS